MLRFAFKFCLLSLFIGTISFAGIFLYVWPQLPEIDELRDVRLQTPLRVYSHDGSFIREFGEVRRTPLRIEEVPQRLINAVLATEDTRFYQHPGFDVRGIARAAWGVIKTRSISQGGASTITMQVAGHYYLDRSQRTLDRKMKEAFLSIKIESELTKDEILELYLNTYYLGHRANGVGAAAEVYYGTTVDKLTLAQQAMIAGLFQRPSKVNPVTNPEAALNRRNHVLKRMLDVGFITREEYNATIKIPVTASLHQQESELEADFVAMMANIQITQDYGDAAINDGFKVYTTIRDKNQQAANKALHKALLDYDRRHGYRGPESQYELSEEPDLHAIQQYLDTFSVIGGLRPAIVLEVLETSAIVYISNEGIEELTWEGIEWAREYKTENWRGPVPRTAADIFKTGDIVRVNRNEDDQWLLSQIPLAEGALVSMDPNNGATLALVGGYDFNRSQYNRVTQATRQPGSSFKPFIYYAALENGYSAASIVNDAPIVTDEDSDDPWKPQNDNRKSNGPVRLRWAITKSLNQVSARLVDDLGVDTVLQQIARFGFDTGRMPHNETIALGSAGISPWESATAYCVLANGGYRVEPFFIERIEDYNGDVIYQANPLIVCKDCDEDEAESETSEIDLTLAQPEKKPETGKLELPPLEEEVTGTRYAERVVDPRTVWIINSMTRSVVQEGTGSKARVLKRTDLSGKTGTTNDQTNAWFAGYNTSIVTVTWVGFDNRDSLGSSEFGSKAALPMWIDYMRVALEDIPDVIPPQPPGLVNIRIDPRTGRPTGADTPGSFFEIFREENNPEKSKQDPSNNIYVNPHGSEQIHDPF